MSCGFNVINQNMKTHVIPHIIDQHAEEAAFLWLLRNNAINSPHYDLDDLDDLDERVEAHIDGLRIANGYGWEVCKNNLEFEEAGELFAASVLALESQSAKKLKIIYEMVYDNPELQYGFIAALSWVNPKHLEGKVSGFLSSKDSFWRRMGIAACAVQRVDPGEYLTQGILDKKENDRELCCCSLKAAGELGRIDLIQELLKSISCDDPNVSFWAAWAALLCGDRHQAVDYLKNYITQGAGHLNNALILFRVLQAEDTRYLLASLKEQANIRFLIQAIGVAGNSQYVSWLIEQMEDPALARVAGESFSLITGVDLAYDDLESDMPEDFEAGPSEDPEDEAIDLDADEDLPWPDQGLINQWWDTHKAEYKQGIRYFMGNPVSESSCGEVLKKGMQRQRYAASLELALLTPGSVLFETHAVAKKQKQALGLLGIV